jgi:hypothetical protein
MTKDEALDKALEAFSVIAIADNIDWIRHQAEQQATAIKQARSAPVQKPYRPLQDNGSQYFGDSWDTPPAQPAPVQGTIAQTFTGLPLRKLRDLQADGWAVNGVSFERTEEDGTARRGAITTGGMVLWWNPPAGQAVPETNFGDMAAPVQPVQEPIYQMQMMDGKWIDQAKQSYEYNKAHGHTVRIVYTTPPATQPAAWEAEMRAELAKLGFDGQCPESIGITLISWFDAYAKSLTPDELAEKSEARLKFGEVGNIVDAFERGYRQCERDHGITEKGQP